MVETITPTLFVTEKGLMPYRLRCLRIVRKNMNIQSCTGMLMTKLTPLSVSLTVALLAGNIGTAQATESTADNIKDAKAAYERLQQVSAEGGSQQELYRARTELFLECQQVKTDAARLACYDKVAEFGETPSFVTTKKPLDLAKTFQTTISGNPQVVLVGEEVTLKNNDNESDSVDDKTTSTIHTMTKAETEQDSDVSLVTTSSGLKESEQQILKKVGVTQQEVERYTPLSLAYDLDKNDERGTWSARPHRPMYLLPIFMNMKPNRHPETPSQDKKDYTFDEMRVPELKLQVSVKTKVAEDLFDTNADLWFGYTQQSHWQVYNADNSRPFRATDYEPEIFLTQPVKADLPFGGRLRMLGAGAVHHSNGQSDPLSRSWNRVYLMGGAEWGKLSVVPRLWARINTNTDSEPDDNSDITDYLGYGDVTFLYDFENKQTLGGTLRYNPKTNKGALQLDYIHPISNNINGYIQLFHGYGESIIDYNHEGTAIGIGVVLNDWKGL